MNGKVKFHSPDGPAFAPGQVWEGVSGTRCEILRVERYGVDKWDVDVFYWYPSDDFKRELRKNTWSFQVRYQHEADRRVKLAIC